MTDGFMEKKRWKKSCVSTGSDEQVLRSTC